MVILSMFTCTQVEIQLLGTAREPKGNESLVDIISHVITYFSQMFSPLWHGKWQWRHLIRGALWKFKNQQRFLFISRTLHFWPYVWILSRDPGFSVKVKEPSQYVYCILYNVRKYVYIHWYSEEEDFNRYHDMRSSRVVDENKRFNHKRVTYILYTV